MRGETILMAGCEPWEHWRQTHNLAYLLARENRVVFTYPAVRYEQRAGHRDYARRFRRQEVRWVADNLAVLESPPMLPWTVPGTSRRLPAVALLRSIRLSKRIQATILRHRLRKLGLAPTVLSVWHPFDLLLAGRLGERVSWWYLYDEVAHFPDNAAIAPVLDAIERDGIRRADVVFAASQVLYEKRKGAHPGLALVPNGADFALFNQALTSDLPEPPDLRRIPHPRIGLIAALAWPVDYELLVHVADSHPDWSVVLIGQVRDSGCEGVAAVTARPNGYALGYKPQPELPAYLRGFDAGLMPYRLVGSVWEAFPLKLFEYLAAGLPVVSTPQPAVLAFGDVVGVAEDAAGFVRAIERALATNSPEKVAERVALARENSWERRLAEIEALVDPFLYERSRLAARGEAR